MTGSDVQRPDAPPPGRATLATSEHVRELSAMLGARPHPVSGEVSILCDGEVAFGAMLALIDRARSRVCFENFIFAGDETGRRFAAALAAAADRGVAVRVLYDPIGTLMVRGGSIARTLRGSGVTLKPFGPLSPVAPWTWSRLRHRDHRKSLCVDGEFAVVGGLCISDNWSPSSRGGRGWRDTALQVGGTVVGDLEATFEATWRGSRAADGPGASVGAAPVGPPAVMLAADRPGSRCVGRLYRWLGERATRSIDITDAYLVVPEQVIELLADAARRGVAVRLLLPGRNNHPLAGAAARRSYEQLLDAGVEIWEWSGAMVHAKTAVVDQELVLVGSSNLDPLSLRRNYELNLLVVDPGTGRAMGATFERDLQGARRIDPGEWARRPRWQRAGERAARLFAPDL